MMRGLRPVPSLRRLHRQQSILRHQTRPSVLRPWVSPETYIRENVLVVLAVDEVLTFRPKRTEKSEVCVAAMTLREGSLPISQAGSSHDVSSDLPWRGAMLIITLLSLPSATSWNFSAMMRWCGPSMKMGQTWRTKSRKLLRAFSTLFKPCQ